jgi:UDP-N-acetylmuramoyl-L-alanyl-D-glutamate--2,6-diaminopimelate ligase
VSPDHTEYLSLTTLDPVGLHQRLASLAAEGVDHLAIEASSHGLDQYRLDGVRITAAAFTNLSRDHLDYHDSMASYLAAKRRLFDELLAPDGTAVLNADAPEYAALERACRARGHRVLSYGRNGRDLVLEDAQPTGDGQRVRIRVEGQVRTLHLSIAGAYQATNALCALGLAIATGAPAEAATEALASLKGVHGRIELVARHPNGAAIYVDYAHKPGALEAVLKTLRPHTQARLVVVFGCGGDRDRGKRPIMGEIAERLADRVVVTDDNPRSEDPAAIRAEILAACRHAIEIGDRGEAIRRTIGELAPGDLLVIAGKGHETGQIVGSVTHPFDDSDVARAAVAALRREGTA